MDLKIFNEIVRPCMAKGHRAAFHRWVEHSYVESPGVMIGSSNGGQVTYLTALVEFETGQVVEVRPEDIVFRDGIVNSYLHEYLNLMDNDRYEEFVKSIHFAESMSQ